MTAVSVIIPAYNASETVGQALESVFAQTYADFEIIVVDDASSDGTTGAVNSLMRQFVDSSNRHESSNPPFDGAQDRRIIELPSNQGPAAARNRGVAEAEGEWIAFLDADDAWLPERLEVQLAAAAEHPDVALWCASTLALGERTRMTDDGGRMTEVEKDPSVVCRPSSVIRQIPLEEFALGNPVATSTVLVRKNVLEELGGFDEQFRGTEDYDLWMRIAAKRPVMRIEQPLVCYREHAGSLSMDDRTFLPQALAVLDKAFSSGGVLEAYSARREHAVARQYWHASWMAFSRGDRRMALGHLLRGRKGSTTSKRKR